MPSILTYLLLQAPAEVASADVVQEVEVNVLQLLMEGGWYIMIPLALMSLIGMYVFFERFLAIRKADKVSPDFMQKLKDYISQGNLSSARNLCADSNTPVARMLDKNQPHRQATQRHQRGNRKRGQAGNLPVGKKT